MNKEIKEYLERNKEAKVQCEKILDKELKTNDGLRKVFEKDPEKRELYIYKMLDSGFW